MVVAFLERRSPLDVQSPLDFLLAYFEPLLHCSSLGCNCDHHLYIAVELAAARKTLENERTMLQRSSSVAGTRQIKEDKRQV